jgi:2-oxoglutarate ferredoxin oxidoreductase subunit beta
MADFVPPAEEILAKYNEGEAISVKLHDGGTIVLRKLDKGYDPTSRISAITKLMSSQDAKEIVTGLLYIDESQPEMHELNNTSKTPLRDLPYKKICPGNDVLQKIQARYR